MVSRITFLAAHAPKIVPSWFVPEMETKKPDQLVYPIHKFGKSSNHPQKDIFSKYFDFECEEWLDEDGNVPQQLKDEVAEYIKLMEINRFDRKEWDDFYRRQHIAQWPWYWAKLVESAPNAEVR